MFSYIDESDFFSPIIDRIVSGRHTFVESLSDCFKGVFYSYIAAKTQKNIVIVTGSDNVYPLFAEILSLRESFGISGEVAYYPEDDSFMYRNIQPSKEIAKIRSRTVKLAVEPGIKIIVTDINAVSEKIQAPEKAKDLVFNLRKNMDLSQEKLAAALNDNGFERNMKVEDTYEYSVRGSIVDIFSPDYDYPIRLEFYGDIIESIRFFSLDTYATTKETDEITLILFNPGSKTGRGENTFLEYFDPKDTLFVMDDPDLIKAEIIEKISKIEKYIEDEQVSANIFTVRQLYRKINPFCKLKAYSVDKGRHGFKIKSRLNPSFNRDMSVFFDYIVEMDLKGYHVFITSDNEGETKHIISMIEEKKEEAGIKTGNVSFINAEYYRGCVLPDIKFCLVSNREIFERYKGRVLPKTKNKNLKPVKHYLELEKNDFIVHREHGIGVFEGVKAMTFDDVTGDFISIRYEGSDKLYIPIYKIDLIDKFIGSDKEPALSKLGTTVFRRTKADIEKEMKLMAAELLKIYASRKAASGIVFANDSEIQKEFEDSFIHEETPDQAKAIVDVKNDMEMGRQMDRLVCGDAGFGKTEIAMRAAFKAVNDGYQVLVVTATTLLAQQHANTFRERMADYPVKIEMISRLVTAKHKKEIISGLKEGKVDIVIGTHAVLSASVEFLNLGIVIIDEEQHFGVKHKEFIRKKYPKVDLLTLTATPIPRTLYFSLSGIRDITIINTPPPEKKAIETVIVNDRINVIKEIILREVLRHGQVFYVHNNIHNIEQVQHRLEQALPEIRFRHAHGRMEKIELEKIMTDFLAKKFDVLITTTIIESGLDMPDVNTIIISNAERFGLSQLYQLRGRVGRRARQAFAYLMVKDAGMLTGAAKERLKTIESYVDPGAGFRIAMKDLELRGAGNILGTKQHGNMEKIGFELYCRMLEDAVAELEGEPKEIEKDTKIKFAEEAHIPDDYIWDTGEKVRIYRKLFMASTFDEIDTIRDQIKDAWGELPESAGNIFYVAKLKLAGKKLKADEVISRNGKITVEWYEKPPISIEQIRKAGVKNTVYSGKSLEITAPDSRESFQRLRAVVETVFKKDMR
jgi:transcription-repair coupling factor (superfamily II helicase)